MDTLQAAFNAAQQLIFQNTAVAAFRPSTSSCATNTGLLQPQKLAYQQLLHGVTAGTIPGDSQAIQTTFTNTAATTSQPQELSTCTMGPSLAVTVLLNALSRATTSAAQEPADLCFSQSENNNGHAQRFEKSFFNASPASALACRTQQTAPSGQIFRHVSPKTTDDVQPPSPLSSLAILARLLTQLSAANNSNTASNDKSSQALLFKPHASGNPLRFPSHMLPSSSSSSSPALPPSASPPASAVNIASLFACPQPPATAALNFLGQHIASNSGGYDRASQQDNIFKAANWRATVKGDCDTSDASSSAHERASQAALLAYQQTLAQELSACKNNSNGMTIDWSEAVQSILMQNGVKISETFLPSNVAADNDDEADDLVDVDTDDADDLDTIQHSGITSGISDNDAHYKNHMLSGNPAFLAASAAVPSPLEPPTHIIKPFFSLAEPPATLFPTQAPSQKPFCGDDDYRIEEEQHEFSQGFSSSANVRRRPVHTDSIKRQLDNTESNKSRNNGKNETRSDYKKRRSRRRRHSPSLHAIVKETTEADADDVHEKSQLSKDLTLHKSADNVRRVSGGSAGALRRTHHRQPVSIKGQWTEEEDSKLAQLVGSVGTRNWAIIAKCFGDTRVGKQCRERWVNHLDPSISRLPWTLQEEAVVFAGQERYGHLWSKISGFLSGRSDNHVKNHWNCHMKKFLSPNSDKYNPNYAKELKVTAELMRISDFMHNTSDRTHLQFGQIPMPRELLGLAATTSSSTVEFVAENDSSNMGMSLVESIVQQFSAAKSEKSPPSMPDSQTLNYADDNIISPVDVVVESQQSPPEPMPHYINISGSMPTSPQSVSSTTFSPPEHMPNGTLDDRPFCSAAQRMLATGDIDAVDAVNVVPVNTITTERFQSYDSDNEVHAPGAQMHSNDDNGTVSQPSNIAGNTRNSFECDFLPPSADDDFKSENDMLPVFVRIRPSEEDQPQQEANTIPGTSNNNDHFMVVAVSQEELREIVMNMANEQHNISSTLMV